MKRKKYFCMLWAALQVGMFYTCSEDDGLGTENEMSSETITKGEAKAFFEEQMMQIGNVLDKNEALGFASNFTPQWNKAVVSGRDSMAAVDVPIVTDYSFMVSAWADETQEGERVETLLRQKLVVVKDLNTNHLGVYLVTIIPDHDYVLSRKEVGAMDFPNYGDYGNFSGRIIYSLPLSTAPLRVDRYQNGQLIDFGSFFGVWDNEEKLQKEADKMKELLAGYSLIQGKASALRAGEMDGGMLPEVVITASGGGGGNYPGFPIYIVPSYNDPNATYTPTPVNPAATEAVQTQAAAQAPAAEVLPLPVPRLHPLK
ncbi:MAG: hypothetical protein FWF52_09915 [Candidatus Azobacteroides sp.]|nr:hypothetical protein [Candidatus Azobacteroides sp.]